jgi:hypothetical protein
MDIEEYSVENGYHMGVYLCLGQPIHLLNPSQAININKFNSYESIHQHMSERGKIFIFLGKGLHKIKKKAEQFACENAIMSLQKF